MVREIVILALACSAMMATPSAALPKGDASALLRRKSRAWVWETGGEMNRLRGGGFFTVSKPVWPILNKDEIPE